MAMTTAEALRIVLDLARQNVIDERDDPEEYERQIEACNIVLDMAVHEYGVT